MQALSQCFVSSYIGSTEHKEETKMANNTGYIPHLHAFRGFAIINIVAAHCWSFMIFWTGNLSSEAITWLFWLTETLFHGSTLYFAILSGLLYSKVLHRMPWRRFYQNKVNYVLLPYIAVTLTFTAVYWPFFLQQPAVEDSFSGYVGVASKNLITGNAGIHFWYIPVLIAIFLATPLLSLLQRNTKYGIWLVALIPLLVSRSPFPDFLKPQSFVFFIGAYALGMAIGANYERVQLWLGNQLKLLSVVAFIASIGVLLTYVLDYQQQGMFSLRQSLIYVQKTTICLLVLHWFARKENTLPNWLSTLGTYAFAIFFLHVVFIDFVIQAVRETLAESRTVELIGLFGSLNLLVGVLGSVFIAAVMRWLLKKHSRHVLGV